MKIKYRSDVLNIEKEIIKNRRDFHKYPELSFQEYRTSKIVAKLLKSLSSSSENFKISST